VLECSTIASVHRHDEQRLREARVCDATNMCDRAAVVTVEAALSGELCLAHDGATDRLWRCGKRLAGAPWAADLRGSAAAKDKRSLESRLSHLDQTGCGRECDCSGEIEEQFVPVFGDE
jgi:hypothetical protein